MTKERVRNDIFFYFKILNVCTVKYTAMCLYIFAYIYAVNKYFVKNLIFKLGNALMSMNANEEMHDGNANTDASNHDADPGST